nr:uncharacterized protein LOC101252425 [Solanum lycopersicum]
MDPLKYIFQKAMPIGKLAKWQMLLSEFDIMYVTQKAIKAQALADHLAENPVDKEYEPLKTYFHDEEVLFAGDGVTNHQGKGIGAVLVSECGQHYPMAAKLRFNCTNNMAEYEACIHGLRMTIDMNTYSRIQNELANALSTIASMIKHPDTDYIDPLDVELKEHPVHCSHIESEPDDLPWYFDIKRYLESGTYPKDATSNQKKSIRRVTLNFFLNGEVMYKRTPDLGLLRCVDAAEAVRLIEQIHAGVCGTHMNGLTLARKVLRAGYFRMTMENGCFKFVQKCHKCQVHGDLIRVPPHELNAMISPWTFVAWGMDVIGPIEPSASNGHRFILVAIDYFTKWVKAVTYKSVTMKVVVDFVRNNLICRFGVPASVITDNGANLNSYFMRDICEQFKIIHRKSTAYRPQMNGTDEYKGKFAPKWQGTYMVHKVLSGGALVLSEMDGSVWPKPINSDAEEHPIQNEKSLEQGALDFAEALLEAEDVVEVEANLDGKIVVEIDALAFEASYGAAKSVLRYVAGTTGFRLCYYLVLKGTINNNVVFFRG